MALAYEADHVFTNLVCLSDHGMQIPVVVKLGHDCLQVASVSSTVLMRRKELITPEVAETRSHVFPQVLYHRRCQVEHHR